MFLSRVMLASVFVFFTVSLQGCAGFKANNIAHINPADLKSTTTKPAKVYTRWVLNSKSALVNDQIKVAAAAIHKKNFEASLSATSCCVLVESLNEADVVVDGTFHDENNKAAMIPAFITGLSLYTIPSWVTAKVHITANAQKDGKTHSYDVSDSMTMVQWLPMIFAFPFANPFTTGKEVDTNTYNALVLKMKGDGIL